MGRQHSIRIGTRGSQLALVQANHIKHKLLGLDQRLDISIVIIRTTGDQCDRSISDMGGKGVFVKDIEQSLLNHDVDIAVHSFKDITSIPHDALRYSGFILEERPTDAFILFNKKDIANETAQLGTGSLRRKALCEHLYPKVECVPIRGNIDSRIEKAEALKLDGLILSTAGLQRIKNDHVISFEADPLQFIPAPGQGMLAIQNRIDDNSMTQLIEAIVDPQTQTLGQYYFEFLRGIQFNCTYPLGAIIHNQEWHVFLGHEGPHYFKHELNDIVGLIQQVKGVVYG